MEPSGYSSHNLVVLVDINLYISKSFIVMYQVPLKSLTFTWVPIHLVGLLLTCEIQFLSIFQISPTNP